MGGTQLGIRRWWMQALRGLLWLLLVSLSGAAHAVCSTAAGNVNMGTISSLALQTTTVGNLGAAGISCNGGLSLLSGAYLRVMLDTANLNLTNVGYSVPFTISTTQNGAPLQNGVTATVSALSVLSLGGGSAGLALYFTVPMGPNVQAGTYTGTVNLRWYYAICESGLLGACAWDRSPGLVQNCAPVLTIIFCTDPTNWGAGVQTSATLTLVVTKSCLINTSHAGCRFRHQSLGQSVHQVHPDRQRHLHQ